MNEQFTPGPWYRQGMTVYALQGSGVFVGKGENYHEQQVNRFCLHVQEPSTPDQELEANARLIAAAPELYEALKAIIEKRMIGHNNEAAYIPPEIELAYKALAKATGNSNV